MLFTCVMFIVHFSFPNFFFSGGVGGGGETKKRVHGLGPKWEYMDLGSTFCPHPSSSNSEVAVQINLVPRFSLLPITKNVKTIFFFTLCIVP